MMKVFKKIIVIILLISTIFNTMPTINAATTVELSGGVKETETFKPDEEEKEQPPFAQIIDTSSTTSYSCAYKNNYSLWDQSANIISVYDKNNNDIIQQGFVINSENLPLAGTAVGLTIKERRLGKIALRGVVIKKTKSELVTSTKTNTTTVYKCKYKTTEIQALPGPDDDFPSLEPKPGKRPQCLDTEKPALSETECPIPARYCKQTDDSPYPEEEITEEEYQAIVTADKTYYLDFTTGMSVINADSEQDANVINDCINSAASWLRGASTWRDYSEASYDIYLTDSNDATSTTKTVILSDDRANLTEKYYNIYGKEVICDSGKCTFQYKPGYVSGKQVYIGKFYIEDESETNPSSIPNRLAAYLITQYYYEKDKTCINIKTGEVSYIPSSSGPAKSVCNTATEYEINNDIVYTDQEVKIDGHIVNLYNVGETHWHYFIPLNAKSLEGINFKYQGEYHSKRTVSACKSALKEYYIRSDGLPTGNYKYPEVIRPNTATGLFVGDYYCKEKCGTPEAVFNEDSQDLKLIENFDGCREALEKQVLIKQLFYNEKVIKDAAGDDTNKFNGFNFYYRPIDTENVFPNGIASSSLWTDWGSVPDASPDISKSYSITTYVAHDISAQGVRNYNKNNPYTSWDTMNTNGTSQYIDTSGIIRRAKDYNADLIYKLGCGPANQYEYLKNPDGTNKVDASHHPIKNPLYQEECSP